MANDFINAVQQALLRAENLSTRLPADVLSLEGMSGIKNRIFLNEVCRETNNYLEIGSWKGSTAIAASYDNPGHFQCIENFSQFGGPRNEFIFNIEKYKDHCNIELIEGDCWMIDKNKINFGIDVYFFDGLHDYANQKVAMTHFANLFSGQTIVIVDDYNDKSGGVQKGTLDGIADAYLDILFSKEVGCDRDSDAYGWWCGLGIFVVSK